MNAERFNRLRHRLDALKAGRSPSRTLLARARAMFVTDDGEVDLTALVTLDRELEQAGVQTSADAKLLREVGQARGRLGELARGLTERAVESLTQFERAVDEAERLLAAEREARALLTRLEADFVKLARIVKVAAVFAAPTAGFEIFQRPAAGQAAPQRARVAVAEFYSERAKATVGDSGQKRRDVDLAYELVLQMSAEAKDDRDRLRQLRVELGGARERLRSAPVVRSLDELVRHVRHTARSDPRTAFRSLRGLYDRAVEGGDVELAQVVAEALASAIPRGTASQVVEREAARRLLGWREGPRVEGEVLTAGGRAGLDDAVADDLTRVAFELDDDEQRALELAAGASRFFDVEDSLTEELAEAETQSSRPVQRRVTYPTQLMTYEMATGFDQVHTFVLTHPGTVLLDMASGRQLVRSYLEEEPARKPKSVKKTAVRVYVLDASGSMHGARARFRDAIVIAELNAIRVKARAGLPYDPLYFSFFNDVPTELHRVDTGDEAARQIEKLFASSPAEGQTDISLALMSAFESIGQAQGRDPYLARATVVLVTDGEDGVDLELIRRTKKPFTGLDIALSFISLGEENADLKSLVLEQRAQGARAFYHHLSDAEIALARTEFDSSWRTLLPRDVPVGRELAEQLLPHLEALEAIASRRPVTARARADLPFDTLFPLPNGVAPQGASLFPKSRSAPLPVAAAVRTRVVDVLEAIAEAAPLASLDARPTEAVELLSHLLQVYSLGLPRYLEALGDEAVFTAAAKVRAVCKPFD
jgi:Mg-chelatase subunit ChlD